MSHRRSLPSIWVSEAQSDSIEAPSRPFDLSRGWPAARAPPHDQARENRLRDAEQRQRLEEELAATLKRCKTYEDQINAFGSRILAKMRTWDSHLADLQRLDDTVVNMDKSVAEQKALILTKINDRLVAAKASLGKGDDDLRRGSEMLERAEVDVRELGAQIVKLQERQRVESEQRQREAETKRVITTTSLRALAGLGALLALAWAIYAYRDVRRTPR